MSKSKSRDMFGIFKLLMNEEKTKMWNSGFLLQKEENVQEENRGDAEARFFIFIERESTLSL